MKPRQLAMAMMLAGLPLGAAGAAEAFSLTFEWGKLKLCTSGYPNIVTNPVFRLANVPAGTRTIEFTLTDLNVPRYRHGGGTVVYAGANVIDPGAFTYKSPCPPDGAHTYQWTAVAKGAGGEALGRATSKRTYPE